MVIYKITNLLNEKIYIGQTKQPIEKRFLQHSKANSPLGQAMRDCGLENFTIEVIERYQNELNEREKFWIKVLKSKSPNGYNQNNGGSGVRVPSNVIPFRDVARLGDVIREYRVNNMSMGDFAKNSGITLRFYA